MGFVKTRLLVIFAAVAAASAAGRTIHRSFRGGLPSAVSEARQNAAEIKADDQRQDDKT